MKQYARILSALLIVAMLIPVTCVAEINAPAIYIPKKVGRLHLPDMTDLYGEPLDIIQLKTVTESIPSYEDEFDTDPCPVLPVANARIDLYFSEQPDWAAVNWENGWEYLDVDENGHAVTSMAGHRRQPGTHIETVLDVKTGKYRNVAIGDEAFSAGKGPVTVYYRRSGKPYRVEYVVEEDDYFKTDMDGAVTVVTYDLVTVQLDCGEWTSKDMEDPELQKWNDILNNYPTEYMDSSDSDNPDGFNYQMLAIKDYNGNVVATVQLSEDGKAIITDASNGKTIEITGVMINDQMQLTLNWFDYSSTDVWYISSVKTTYPSGNFVVGVEADFRNDINGTLYGYKISYCPGENENEIYTITYAPKDVAILEDHTVGNYYVWNNYVLWPDTETLNTDLEKFFRDKGDYTSAVSSRNHSLFYRTYSQDQVLYGVYTDGEIVLVSGSGDNLDYWYLEGHGLRSHKPGLLPCTYFESPRIQ